LTGPLVRQLQLAENNRADFRRSYSGKDNIGYN